MSFSLEEAFNCIYDLLCGVYNMHSVGIIHSDLSTNNIMVDKHNVFHIIDLGFSQWLGENIHWGTPSML